MIDEKKILVVDDIDHVREYVSAILKKEGYSIVEAENGKEALDILNKETIGMVITDLQMPVMNGIELTRQLRRYHLKYFIPVIMLTSSNEFSMKMESKIAGVNEWIEKPFNPKTLVKLVSKWYIDHNASAEHLAHP